LHQELCPCDLAAVVGLTAAAVSHHLRTLRQLRLVKSRREGKQVYYSLDDSHIQTLLDVAAGHIQHIAGISTGHSPETEESAQFEHHA
jgi:DNA-binding transcriptional ArsR family regulator